MVPLPLAVALLLQAHHPTVGDTVWVTIAVRASGRVVLRPQPWDLGELGQVLGPAELISRGDSVQVRYPVAFWLAGEHQLEVPGPIIVTPTGGSDTLPPRRLAVHIASVLPAGVDPARILPRPEAPLVPRQSASLLPFLVLELVAGLLAGLAGLRWWSVNRPRAPTRAPPPPPGQRAGHLARWAGAGELRVALGGWGGCIREELARRPDPAVAEGAQVLLDAIERAEFGPADRVLLERLLRAAREWVERRGGVA